VALVWGLYSREGAPVAPCIRALPGAGAGPCTQTAVKAADGAASHHSARPEKPNLRPRVSDLPGEALPGDEWSRHCNGVVATERNEIASVYAPVF